MAGAVHLFPDQKGSVAFGAALVVLLVTIILCGPGRYSVDGSRGWARRPGIGSVSMVIGIALAVGVWMLFNGTNPLDSPGNPWASKTSHRRPGKGSFESGEAARAGSLIDPIGRSGMRQ